MTSKPSSFRPSPIRGGNRSFPELEAARTLVAEVRSRADEFESARRLPADLARKFAEAGLFRITIPKTYGGSELHPVDCVRIIEELSCADGSAGWCLMIGAVTAILAGLLPEPWAREIYGSDPHVITGGAVAPTAEAVPVSGGYRVTGRWQWGSGSQNCQWIVGGALVMDGESPRRLASGEPENKLMIFSIDQVEILDTWNSSGLRGTGSHDFVAHDAFVPEDRAITLGLSAPVVETPLCRFPIFGLLAIGVCAVALGVARRAIDELVALAATKKPTWDRATLAQTPRIQADVARAEAAVRSARAFLFDAIEAAWRTATEASATSLQERRDLRLAAANATWESAKAVDLMYHAGGGSSVHADNPLQRCFRDVHAITQHRMVSQSVYEETGRLYLGSASASIYL
jgi:indole-3-acetate monooxygenase